MSEKEKVCSQCGNLLKNDTYGSRCEDCYCEALPHNSTSMKQKSALFPKGTKVTSKKNNR